MRSYLFADVKLIASIRPTNTSQAFVRRDCLENPVDFSGCRQEIEADLEHLHTNK